MALFLSRFILFFFFPASLPNDFFRRWSVIFLLVRETVVILFLSFISASLILSLIFCNFCFLFFWRFFFLPFAISSLVLHGERLFLIIYRKFSFLISFGKV